MSSLEWDSFAHFQVITLFSLLFVLIRLYTTNQEIQFLNYISFQWMPNELKLNDNEQHNSATNNLHRNDILTNHNINNNNAHKQLEDFRLDIDHIVVNIKSARTLLYLSMAFILVFIISWIWMSNVIVNRRCMKTVSLKAILFLAVFAAVDIVASGGFVIVRLSLYFLRDDELKIHTTPSTDFNHMMVIAAFHLHTLQSKTAITEILVSLIIGCLTCLRIYSVVGAVKLYNKIRRNKDDRRNIASSVDEMSVNNGKIYNEYIPRPSIASVHQDMRRYSMCSMPSYEEDTFSRPELKVQAVEMPAFMQKLAIKIVNQACQLYTTEKHIAEYIKQDFDDAFQPTWHCIVGKNWGSCVTHSKQCYMRLKYKDMTILIYKAS